MLSRRPYFYLVRVNLNKGESKKQLIVYSTRTKQILMRVQFQLNCMVHNDVDVQDMSSV